MKEVSCRITCSFAELAERRGIPATRIFEGAGVPHETLLDPRKRVDWDPYIRVIENCHRLVGSDAAFHEFCTGYGTNPALRYVRTIARLLADPIHVLRVLADWGGRRNFTCVHFRTRQADRDQIEIFCSIGAPHRPSRSFFVSNLGVIDGIFGMLGLPPPTIDCEWGSDGRSVVYRISHKPRRTLAGSLVRGVRRLGGIVSLAPLVGMLRHQHDELRDAIAALTRQKREFEQLVAAISDGVLILSGDRVLFGNARLVEMTGVGDLAVLLVAPWSVRVPAGQVERWSQQTGVAENTPAADLEIVRPDGARVLCEVRRQGSIRWSEVDAELIVLRDVTERRALERALAHVARREREQVAHDLHDGVGQMLAAAALQAATVATSLERVGAAQARTAAEVAALLRECGGQIRSMAHALSPVTLEARGLVPALRELAATGARLIGLECTVEAPTELPFVPAEVAAEAYRIVQESLSNAARHGKARTARVELRAADGGLWIHVDDDGCGFPEGGTTGPGLGLRIMRHRAASFGGRVGFERAPSGGARVACWVPALPVRGAVESSEAAPERTGGASPGDTASVGDVLRVVLVDDHPVFRRGLAAALGQAGLEIVGQCGEIDAVDAVVGSLRPDVLVTDLLFGERVALDAVRRWRRSWPGLGIVVLTMFPEGAYRAQSLEAGADAYVGKHASPDAILAAVRESSVRRETSRR